MKKKECQDEMESYKINFSDAQLKKLMHGKSCQLKNEQLGEGFDILICPKKMKKMMSAKRKGKGIRYNMSPKELEMNTKTEGGMINFYKMGKIFKKGLKAASKFYKEKIRPAVGPSLKKAIKQGIEVGIPALVESAATLVGQPELGVAALPYAERLAKKVSDPLTERFGRLTGAYGMKSGRGQYTYDDWDPFIKPSSQAFNPTLPLPDFSSRVPARYVQGGALTMGNDNRDRGFAWNPLLPMQDMSQPHSMKGTGYVADRPSMDYLPPASVHTGKNRRVITMTGKKHGKGGYEAYNL